MRFLFFAVVIAAALIYLPRLQTSKEQPPRGGSEGRPSLSTTRPLGSLIFFTRDGRQGLIRERDLVTGKEVNLFSGAILEVGKSNHELLIVRLAVGGLELVSYVPEDRSTTTLISLSTRPTVVLPRLSPDGSLFGFLTQSSPARLEVMNRITKERLTTRDFSDEVSSLEFLTNDRLAVTLGSPPNFSLEFIDLRTREEKRLPEVIGGTISRADDKTILMALFDPVAKASVIGRIGLEGRPTKLTKGPFDDQPLFIDAQTFVFHRLIEGDKRRDQLVLSDHGQETVLTEGLIPLLLRE